MSAARRAIAVAQSRCMLIVALAGSTVLVSAAPAFAQAPEWQVTMTHANVYGRLGGKDPYTLNAGTFSRGSYGNAYTITAGDAGGGGASTSGAAIVDKLPAGIEATAVAGEHATQPGADWRSCNIKAHGGEFECEDIETVNPGEALEPIIAEVQVTADAAPPIDNVAKLRSFVTVSGGEASAEPSQSEEEVNVTPAVPFGIEDFAVHVGEFEYTLPTKNQPTENAISRTEQLEPQLPAVIGLREHTFTSEIERKFTPDTQAAGHPDSVSTDFLLHYIPVPEEEEHPGRTPGEIHAPPIFPAGAHAKEAVVELPPGFVGSILNTPRCPAAEIPACPPNSAVGYVAVDVVPTEGRVLGGVDGLHLQLFDNAGESNFGTVGSHAAGARSVLYNVQPAPGVPAELGFAVDHLPFLLEAKVRSGGDYGVTIGDYASGAEWPASAVTTCGNGVELAFPQLRCKTAGSAKPFLTNPANCTSASEPAPRWTLQTSPWSEPGLHAHKTVNVNVNSYAENRGGQAATNLSEEATSKSELTGCDQLQFNPEVAFGPAALAETQGTTQADEPTGAGLKLTIPQAPEKASANATPALKKITMKLPEGMTVSPSAANGLQACSKAQFWPAESGKSGPEEGREPAVPGACPQASKIATAEVFTPLLSGDPVAGGPTTNQFTCSEGMWTIGPWNASQHELSEQELSFSYKWLRNGKEIPGATAASLALNEGEDFHKTLQCEVTAKNVAGSSVAISQPVYSEEPVKAPFPPPSLAPLTGTTEGTAAVGSELGCASGEWSGGPESPFGYQWLRDGVPIETAHGNTYKLQEEDAGKVIQCQVAGRTESATDVALAVSPAVIVSPKPAPWLPPLPGGALRGNMYVGEPECGNASHPEQPTCTSEDAENGKLFPLFIQLLDPLGLPPGSKGGIVIKLKGATHVINAKTGYITGTETDQLETVFEGQPQQPFEVLRLNVKGGPQAPLANPQKCGEAKTTTDLTPWSTPQTPDATVQSSFEVGLNGGGPCPGATALPFAPSFNAGTTVPSAGASTDFELTFGRSDGQQDLSGVTVHMPPGLVGRIPAVQLCGEGEALAQKEEAAADGHARAHCPAGSAIGTATALAGPGTHPFQTEGTVYLTGPIKRGPFPNAPFGLVVDTPAEAGPFNFGHVVVLSGITIDPSSAAVTATSEPLPTTVGGLPIRLREIHVDITKQGFMLNPTNCSAQQVSATLEGETLDKSQQATAQVSSPFAITGCQSIPFAPVFTASTQAHTSKTQGASLKVNVTYPPGVYANIAKTLTELPTQLPSRLSTLQKACVDTVFDANPAACPEGSVVGDATARTPTLNQPLVGPAYLVSHGGAAFPDLEILLQGEGVKVVLDGGTDIKKGITITTFNSLPDSPVSEFELNLPEGPHSALAANIEPCSKALSLPTVLTGQNGAVIKQNTHIAVTGCPPTVALTKAKIEGGFLVLTVKTSAKGTVKITGTGLKATKKSLAAGTHRVRVPLTKAGRSMRRHRKRVNVHVTLAVAGNPTVAKSASVRL